MSDLPTVQDLVWRAGIRGASARKRVENAISAAVKAQREADARIADRHAVHPNPWGIAARTIAHQIRTGATLPDPPQS